MNQMHNILIIWARISGQDLTNSSKYCILQMHMAKTYRQICENKMMKPYSRTPTNIICMDDSISIRRIVVDHDLRNKYAATEAQEGGRYM